MATTYSSSRISLFQSCKLKYSLQYQKGYYTEETKSNVLARKGIAFHTLAETYESTWTEEVLNSKRLELEKKYDIPEEYSLETPMKLFKRFYEEVINPVELNGGKLNREIELSFSINNSKFTGKLDALLSHSDGTFQIIDYKTGKSTNTSYYSSQMMLYVYAVAMSNNIKLEDAANKISVSLFFPLAETKGEDYTKNYKKIKFSYETMMKEIDNISSTVSIIEKGEWNPKEANISKLCEWCPFIGRKEYCEASAISGLYPVRGIVIKQRDWAKNAGIK